MGLSFGFECFSWGVQSWVRKVGVQGSVLAFLLWPGEYFSVGKSVVGREVMSWMSWDVLEAKMHFEQIWNNLTVLTVHGHSAREFECRGTSSVVVCLLHPLLFLHCALSWYSLCAIAAKSHWKNPTESIHFSHIVSVFTTTDGVERGFKGGKSTFLTAVSVVYSGLGLTSEEQLVRSAFINSKQRLFDVPLSSTKRAFLQYTHSRS